MKKLTNSKVVYWLYLLVVLFAALELALGMKLYLVSASFFLNNIVLKVCIENEDRPFLVVLILILVNMVVLLGPSAMIRIVELLKGGAL